MSPTTPPPSRPDDPAEGTGPASADADLALYALGALDDHELRSIETLLATDATSAVVEARLGRVAGSMAAVADGIETPPPLDLRDRVLAAARAERAPSPTTLEPMTPAELHRIEAERLVDLVRSLRADDWDAPVDPPELAGWTVRDLVAHVTTIESYAAAALGVTDPAAPETHASNEERTRHAIERHRRLRPEDAVAELERFVDAVDRDVAERRGRLDRTIRWWDAELPVGQVLVVRSFELWTHAADIARAVGRPEPVPAAPALRTMSSLAAGWTALMCAVSGRLPAVDPGSDRRWVRIVLTGPGGATHDVALDPDQPAVGRLDGVPTATLTLDTVDYCRAVGNRVDAGTVPFDRTGDPAVADAVIASLPALAVL